MKYPLIILVVLFTSVFHLKAQEIDVELPRFSHAVYVEFLGSSILISGNYELGYRYNSNSRSEINFRIGGGKTVRNNETLILGSSISVGKRKNFLEIGISRMFEISDYTSKQSLTSFGAGFRFQEYRGFSFHIIPLILFFDEP